MEVHFRVQCSKTRLGQTVFVLGSDPALGVWRIHQAVALETNPERFPLWWSKATVHLPSGGFDFKFCICSDDRRGPVLWETIRNRVLQPPVFANAGEAMLPVLQVQAVWDDQHMATSDAGLGIARLHAPLAAPLAKNFSRLVLDEGDLSEVDNDASGTGGTDMSHLTPLEHDVPASGSGEPPSDEPAQSLMRHVMSVSALSFIAGPEEKTLKRLARRSGEESGYKAKHFDTPVVIVSSEIAPWSKTGGLALVASSLSYEFAVRGRRTMAVSPLYTWHEGMKYCASVWIWLAGQEHEVRLMHTYLDFGCGTGCDYVFVEHECFRDRSASLYCNHMGVEYDDNLFRFALLSIAALEAPLILRLGTSPYGDRVTFLANDWQTGLVPLYLVHRYRRKGVYMDARAIYVAHNLGHQGNYSYGRFPPETTFRLDRRAAQDMEMEGSINLCKAGLVCSDWFVAVSPNYAKEIQRRQSGCGLDEFVRWKAGASRLAGIMNGIDDAWDPESDVHIARNYSQESFLDQRVRCKVALQEELGLISDPSAALLGFVGRLTWQKGVDLVVAAGAWLMDSSWNGVANNIQMILMGRGDQNLCDDIRRLERRFPGRVCGYVGFDPVVEHRMMAGCDMMLMPSRYEPCGLPQMCAQRYGSIPVATKTGGLVDSICSVEEGLDRATGFLVSQPIDVDRLKVALLRALRTFYGRPLDFQRMQQNAMERSFGWQLAVDEYERQIDLALDTSPCCL